jgi:hypothetical protein
MRRLIARLAHMDRAEIAWRAVTTARAAADRLRTRAVEPRWSRGDLLAALTAAPELGTIREALSRRDWQLAHRALARYFRSAPNRLVIGPSVKAVTKQIRLEHPQSAAHAAARADRICAGEYDLLGYRGLRFDSSMLGTPTGASAGSVTAESIAVDWHLDPVSKRRTPSIFWKKIPYLDARCGDHKVIWELNRHQHWLALGRAFWLTGDAKYRGRFVAELRDWLDSNPPLIGINWASMLELALRSISWLWAIGLFVEAPDRDGGDEPWLVDLLVGLDRQLTHVEQNLSYYFSPNTHLTGEALALYVVGRALPELAGSERRAVLGRRILLDEARKQIAADGGHCERSTHYHRYTLDFYLLASIVARLTGDERAGEFEQIVGRLAFAARLLADDRGILPHLGDDDGGMLFPIAGRAPDDVRDSLTIAAALLQRPDLQIGRPPEEAFWLLTAIGVTPLLPARTPVPSAALPETGYYVSRSANGDHLIVDGGPHGYGNCGHAHADALSIAMSVRGLRLLIDPGTACYTADPELRDRMRSTALHNTLALDDRPQSVPQGPFQWAHVANTRVLAWRTNDGFDYFDGVHDGYPSLEHRRRVLTLHGDLVVVADLVSGAPEHRADFPQSADPAPAPAGAHAAAVHWHIDPRWTVEAQGRRVTFARDGERVGLIVPHGFVEVFVGDAATGLGWYSPAYGRVDRSTTVRIGHGAAAPFWMMTVFDLNPENPVGDVECLPVWTEAGTTVHAGALRITRAASIDFALFVEPEAGRGGTWRVAEFETDARLLFCRVTGARPVARVAMVDGSFVRTPGRRGFHLALPRVVPDLHLDFTTDARVAGAAFGARLIVGGHEQPIALDRRSAPRHERGIGTRG